jgi:hypothetical protein
MAVSITPAAPAALPVTAKPAMATAQANSSSDPARAAESKPLSIRQQLQQQSRAAILQASQQLSLQSGNEPLALLYTAAIDAINERLAPALGDNALQRGIDQGLNISPEATAGRIVSLTTAMFGRYQDSNPELAFDAQVNRFVEIIAGGIEQGFSEARDILDGLGVLDGINGANIGANIDRTFDLVQQGLKAFADRQLGIETGTGEVEPG